MTDRYSGDPRITLGPDGSDLDYQGGNPVMDRGVENAALLSLFTREGWAGNIFSPPENHIGSDFEKTCEGAVTLSKLADIENSAARSLESKLFQNVEVEATNPKSDRLRVEAKIGPGSVLSLTREGALWTNQSNDPASRRLK
jgi:hypothetical protein